VADAPIADFSLPSRVIGEECGGDGECPRFDPITGEGVARSRWLFFPLADIGKLQPPVRDLNSQVLASGRAHDCDNVSGLCCVPSVSSVPSVACILVLESSDGWLLLGECGGGVPHAL
jgi:hypothetical protein